GRGRRGEALGDGRRLDQRHRQPRVTAIRAAGRALHVRLVASMSACKEAVDTADELIESFTRARHAAAPGSEWFSAASRAPVVPLPRRRAAQKLYPAPTARM